MVEWCSTERMPHLLSFRSTTVEIPCFRSRVVRALCWRFCSCEYIAPEVINDEVKWIRRTFLALTLVVV